MSKYKVIYQDKDITTDLSSALITLEFTDRLEGKAGEITIKLEDHESKFANEWYPETDDKIEVWIGNLYCGAFWVDEVNNVGDRNAVYCTIKAMSVKLKSIIQGKKYKSYKGMELKALAEELASEMGLDIKGEISGTIYDNCTTNDLQFLSEQATKLGYILKVDSGAMVFSKYSDLKKQVSLKVKKEDVISWDIKDKAEGKYSKCICQWYDVTKKKHYKGTASVNSAGGEATIWEEVESNSEAKDRAKSWLEDKNKQESEIELTLTGDELVVAGMNMEIEGFGVKDGSHIIDEAKHIVDRSNDHQVTVKLKK